MPKTIRNVWDKELTFDKLMKAHIDSRKGKGSKKEIILFNLKQEEYIYWLYEELKNDTYQHGKYTTFYVYEPKVRKIEKARYIDRIVHRWLVDNILKPYYLPRFITNSYACINNRGMHKACLDMQKMMKHCKRIWNNYYIIKMDVSKYFQNIDKEILLNILKRSIKDKKVMNLINKIIYSNSEVKSIPIGNYTSQMFANIYGNEADRYIKNVLKVKYYSRYMDDSIILIKTKKEAIETLEKIRIFLKEELKLELNNKTQIFKSSQGVNYCGYKINEYRLKIREKGKRKLKKKVKELKYKIKIGAISSKDAKRYIAGHLGYIKIANTYNIEKNLFEI